MATTLDLIRSKKSEIQAQSGNRSDTSKPTPGKSRWRILPSWRDEADGPEPFWHDFGLHFIREKLDEKVKTVHMCVSKTYGQECPICDIINDGIARAENDAVLDLIKQARAQGRVLVNALQIDGSEPGKVVILDVTSTTFEKILDRIEDAIDEAKEEGVEGYDPLSLKDGIDVVINKTGAGLNTKYDVASRKGKPVDKAVLADLHDLDKYVAQDAADSRNRAISVVKVVSLNDTKTLPGATSSPTSESGTVMEGDFSEDEDDDDDDITSAVEDADMADLMEQIDD